MHGPVDRGRKENLTTMFDSAEADSDPYEDSPAARSFQRRLQRQSTWSKARRARTAESGAGG